MLRPRPLKSHKRAAVSGTAGDVKHDSLVRIAVAQLRIIFRHGDVRAQRFQVTLVALHPAENRTDQTSRLSVGAGCGDESDTTYQQCNRQTKGKYLLYHCLPL